MAAIPGPTALWLVRHGESQGNVADARAGQAGAARLELDVRDPDVPLSDAGRRQAEALGTWLRDLPADRRPTVLLSSPFTRAADTLRIAADTAGLDLPIRYDERLRERDFGAFDGMTGAGIRAEYPEEAQRRDLLGKFYYRPPGGESWADVALRVRSVLLGARLDSPGERLLVGSHQAVVMVFRYVLQELTEPELLELARREPVANCSVTSYEADADGVLRLAESGAVGHLARAEEPVTEEEPVPGEPGVARA
ncbi:histidine phosphatase family protein [Trujillonella endophytica]|uniref:phosphoglycerate mutase (2,3-diphosphoglycerate-dependent) n=1 Tax=Trujillonella endophytica TaxID=673521 RepID=A0A1H8VJV4_9ACTN|nr:histidine phosphatase family protein [Trujillella endophytica]SEP15168.1 Broad specificity phosphatase PhoE [Trujillella endophytica]